MGKQQEVTIFTLKMKGDLTTVGMRALRSFAVDTSVIFYRILKDGTEVVWVLYAARDIPPLF